MSPLCRWQSKNIDKDLNSSFPFSQTRVHWWVSPGILGSLVEEKSDRSSLWSECERKCQRKLSIAYEAKEAEKEQIKK